MNHEDEIDHAEHRAVSDAIREEQEAEARSVTSNQELRDLVALWRLEIAERDATGDYGDMGMARVLEDCADQLEERIGK